jgi:hypothetical protein
LVLKSSERIARSFRRVAYSRCLKMTWKMHNMQSSRFRTRQYVKATPMLKGRYALSIKSLEKITVPLNDIIKNHLKQMA